MNVNCLTLFILLRIFGVNGSCNLEYKFPGLEMPIFFRSSQLQELKEHEDSVEKSSSPLFPSAKDRNRVISLGIGQSLEIACPGRGNHLVKLGTGDAVITCGGDDRLYVKNKVVNPRDIVCERKPRACLRHTRKRCYGDRRGTILLIGWRINPDLFVPFINICWDKSTAAPIYTEHYVHGRSLPHRVASPGRPSFRAGSVFPNSVKKFFKRKSQRKVSEKLLGKVKPAIGSKDYFLSRGHLSPDGDFVLPAEQDATYFFVNVVPQFQGFNGGNWKIIESDIRDLAEDRGIDLQVTTGSLSVLKLRDINFNDVQIYLDPQNSLYPVPEILYKVVYDESSDSGIAVLGLNTIQPSIELLSKFGFFCENICNMLDWIKESPFDPFRGAIICCSLSELADKGLTSKYTSNLLM